MKAIAELASAAVRRVQRGSEIPARLVDIHDAARYISISTKGIRSLIVNGEIPYIQRVPGRSPYLIDLRDLDLWIERQKVRPSTSAEAQSLVIACASSSVTERLAVVTALPRTRRQLT